jgi:hypothetical protein
MRWHVQWLEIAERNWKRLPYEDAQRIAAAVARFAEHREGERRERRRSWAGVAGTITLGRSRNYSHFGRDTRTFAQIGHIRVGPACRR